jgi:alkylation response protein AidB-like acyl-CoA dehydrogenase
MHCRDELQIADNGRSLDKLASLSFTMWIIMDVGSASVPAVDEGAFAGLLSFLAERADETDRLARWPAEQLRRAAEAGVLHWFAPPEFGGVVLPASHMLRRLTQMAAACLSTTFCLTQPAGVVARIAACENEALKQLVLPDLLAGRRLASVGIAHLTTSRRHVQPVMTAREADGEYLLDGVIPWSTGAMHSAWIVTGAVLDDGRQLLAALPTDLPGITVDPPAEMVGLSSTATGSVRCENVRLERRWLMAPVVADVLKFGKGAGTGGLQTSALALGTALAAIRFLNDEAQRRADLSRIVTGLREEWTTIEADLATLADDANAAAATTATSEGIRHRANGLALRAAQAALAAAKGSGYVVGHPAGRWCREALFFLVWSCPAPVANAMLCELARI